MARPILMELPSYDPRAELHSRLRAAPEEYAEALLATLEVLQGLHDRGVLEIMRGALGSSDQVLEILVDVAKSPESIRSLRNLLLAVNLLGAIDPEQLRGLTQAVPRAMKVMTQQDKPPGLWRIALDFLRSRNLRRGLSALQVMLEAFGGGESRKGDHG